MEHTLLPPQGFRNKTKTKAQVLQLKDLFAPRLYQRFQSQSSQIKMQARTCSGLDLAKPWSPSAVKHRLAWTCRLQTGATQTAFPVRLRLHTKDLVGFRMLNSPTQWLSTCGPRGSHTPGSFTELQSYLLPLLSEGTENGAQQ